MWPYLTDIRRLLASSGTQMLYTLALAAFSSVIDILCMVLLPAFLSRTLFSQDDLPAVAFQASLGGLESWPMSLFISAVVIAFLLRGFLSVIIGSVLTRLSERIRRLLAVRLTHFYLTDPFEQALSRPLTHAMTVVNSYSAIFAGSVVLPLLRLIIDAITIIAVIGFLLLIEPAVVMVVLPLLAALGGGYYYAVRRRAEIHAIEATELQKQLAHLMGCAFRSPREVRIFQLQEFFLESMQDTLRKTANAHSRLAAIYAFPRALGELALISLALGYMAYKNAAGVQSGIIVSHMGMLAFAGVRILSSFSQLMSNLASVRVGRHVTRVLSAELQGVLAPEFMAGGNLPPVRTSEWRDFESIELQDVSFRYASRPLPAIKKINLIIRNGESVGLVGPSGAGKSTLSDLLLGLLPPTAGRVLINGRETQLNDLRWWRTVGFVPQAVFMADDTVLRNVAYGIPDAEIDIERVIRALTMAQLRDVVDALPQGLHTRIGDLGVKLSGGQRQRVAIARALYQKRDFLVLDEATSSLDSETERDIVNAINSLHGKVTLLIIAHRESTLVGCDRIIEMREGQIVKVRLKSEQDS